MKGEDGREIIGWCRHCKFAIYKGKKHVIDEEEYMFHKDCDALISDNADYFVR